MSTQAAQSTPSTAELPPLCEGQEFFDCAPLGALAAFMRDRVWLDVQTGDAFLPRVRIVQIVVKRLGDDIVLRQDWLEEGGGDVWLEKQRITVDAANIWRVAPTAFRLDEVEPWGEPPPPPKPEKKPVNLGDELSRAVASGIIIAATNRYRTTEDELKAVADQRLTSQRYVAMLVMFEMTDLTPREITAQFGYRSPMPLVSARDRLRWFVNGTSYNMQGEHVRPQSVRELGREADKLFKPERYRSSRTFPRDYTPVL